MTVLEYERKFSELAKYAPELISTAHLKCRRFERGLRPSLRSKMVLLGLENYEALINRAMTVERDMQETKSIVENRRGKGSGTQQTSESKKGYRGDSSIPKEQPSYQRNRVSKQSRNTEETFQGDVVCYNCRQPGHKSVECPRYKRQKREVKMCYGCGQAGHFLKACPYIQGSVDETVTRNR